MEIWTPAFKSELLTLLEKCKPHPTIIECSSCTDEFGEKNKNWNKCLKYILSKYTGDTGGVHTGYEIYDLSSICKYNDNIVQVAFLLKSGNTPDAKQSLFIQFFDCIHEHDEIDILSIVSPHNFQRDDHPLVQRIFTLIKERKNQDQMFCLILERDLGRIYHDFKKRTSDEG